MKNKCLQSVFAGLLIILLTGSVCSTIPIVHAQSLQYWSDPVNLSNSGSSTDPRIVVSSDGVIRVVWVDAIDGYKYAESADGKTWTSPIKVKFPFSAKNDPRPDFFADENGYIYIVWRDKDNSLHVAQAQAKNFSNPSIWRTNSIIARKTVVAYDAAVDSRGILQVSYVATGDSTTPAGVYYVSVTPGGFPTVSNIYTSEYFRSLDPKSAHVSIADAKGMNTDTLYIAWDDRPQKRILLTKSPDGGKSWGEASQITGPEAVTGLSMPFNVDVGVMNDKALLTWQSGQPGGQCTSYSESSQDHGEQGEQFGQPMKVSGPFPVCTQASNFVLQNSDLSVVLINGLDKISLVAWNGSGWSALQDQSEIDSFTNPVTLDSVVFSCQNTAVRETTLYVVGCDKGNGSDIWFSSRSLGSVEDWFPSSSVWSASVDVMSTDQEISALSSVSTGENTIHAFWIQTPASDGNTGTATIQYVRWNGAVWSSPVPILSPAAGSPVQLNVKADSRGRLLIAWVNGRTGEMFFSWANAERAIDPGEWQSPQYVPSDSKANSSPDILVDASGKIIVAYAIPINEHRGIYFVKSTDDGITWTQPFRVFDATAPGWEIVDQPTIALTGDGRLHVLFKRYSSHAEQRQSVGLYYSQSADGGITWSVPEAVSEDPILWSQIITYSKSTVHRMWQQYKAPLLITFDGLSTDGGLTWNRPAVVSSIDTTTSLPAIATNTAGNLEFLQLNSTDTIFILDRRWDGSNWISQTPKELYVADHGIPAGLTASTTSKGNLITAISVDYPFLSDPKKNDILSMGKSLGSPKVIQTPYPAYIPAANANANMAAGTPQGPKAPATESPAAGLNDSPPFLSRAKNLIGVVLLGGIVFLLVRIFRPAPENQKNRNKTGE